MHRLHTSHQLLHVSCVNTVYNNTSGQSLLDDTTSCGMRAAGSHGNHPAPTLLLSTVLGLGGDRERGLKSRSHQSVNAAHLGLRPRDSDV